MRNPVFDDIANRYILSLFDYTGKWSYWYRKWGYPVIQVDIQHGNDVRLLKKSDVPIYGVLAAPPCTHFAGSGARWWASKGDAALLEGLETIDATMRIIMVEQPVFWALENPVGRLNDYLGKPTMYFNPNEYGGYEGGENDNYTKKTCLWGNFNHPPKHSIPATDGSRIHKNYGGKSLKTKNERSATPMGFARAFAEWNR